MKAIATATFQIVKAVIARAIKDSVPIIFAIVCILIGILAASRTGCRAASPPGQGKVARIYRAEIEMQGVGCIGCIRRIERTLRQKAGVLHADVRPSQGSVLAFITYDARTIKFSQLLFMIQKETNYFRVRKNELKQNRK